MSLPSSLAVASSPASPLPRSQGKARQGNKTGYTGLKAEPSGNFSVELRATACNIERKCLGTYRTAEEAALAYDANALCLRAPGTAPTNFCYPGVPSKYEKDALVVPEGPYWEQVVLEFAQVSQIPIPAFKPRVTPYEPWHRLLAEKQALALTGLPAATEAQPSSVAAAGRCTAPRVACKRSRVFSADTLAAPFCSLPASEGFWGRPSVAMAGSPSQLAHLSWGSHSWSAGRVLGAEHCGAPVSCAQVVQPGPGSGTCSWPCIYGFDKQERQEGWGGGEAVAAAPMQRVWHVGYSGGGDVAAEVAVPASLPDGYYSGLAQPTASGSAAQEAGQCSGPVEWQRGLASLPLPSVSAMEHLLGRSYDSSLTLSSFDGSDLYDMTPVPILAVQPGSNLDQPRHGLAVAKAAVAPTGLRAGQRFSCKRARQEASDARVAPPCSLPALGGSRQWPGIATAHSLQELAQPCASSWTNGGEFCAGPCGLAQAVQLGPAGGHATHPCIVGFDAQELQQGRAEAAAQRGFAAACMPVDLFAAFGNHHAQAWAFMPSGPPIVGSAMAPMLWCPAGGYHSGLGQQPGALGSEPLQVGRDSGLHCCASGGGAAQRSAGRLGSIDEGGQRCFLSASDKGDLLSSLSFSSMSISDGDGDGGDGCGGFPALATMLDDFSDVDLRSLFAD